MLSFTLNRFDLLGWTYIKDYLFLGKYISNLKLSFFIMGSFLLIIGLTIFLSNFLNSKIEKQKMWVMMRLAPTVHIPRSRIGLVGRL